MADAFFPQRQISPAGAERQPSQAEQLRRAGSRTVATAPSAVPTRPANPLRPIQTSKAVNRALTGGRR